ncbi:hypothetical protein CLF_102630 [Clonorchis sinensis]|nr:hypothetical protein CLF_102630 [Clonorchis sinensis]
MPRIQYVGRPSLHYYGKLLSEIVRNLKTRGVGRIVVKETEASRYPEPCFYVLERTVPLLSDSSNVRCRAWARRIFRGYDFGVVLMRNTHEPDWRLVPTCEATALLNRAADPKNAAPKLTSKCVAPMPPLLALYLRRHSRFPDDIIRAVSESADPTLPQATREASGFLLLTKLPDEPTSLEIPTEPTVQEQRRIYPPYQVASEGGLIRKRELDRPFYYIRRADTPGLLWKLMTNKDSDDTKSKNEQSNNVA